MGLNAPIISSKVVADNKQFDGSMQKSGKLVKSFGDKTKKTADKNNVFAKSFKNAANSASILEGPLNGISGRLSSLASGFARLNPAVILSGLAMTSFTLTLVKSVSAFSKLEVQTGRLNALIKSTGAAAGFSVDEISQMSEALGRSTLASAGEMRDAAGILLTFKSITGDTFKQTLALSQDLAAVMGTKAKGAALQLAKALENPLTGLTALNRSGVTFNETEKEKIKLLAESGRQLEAQALILAKVESQIGGAGDGEGKGVAGAVDLLSENWTKFLEVFGKTSGAASATQNFFNNMAKGLARITRTLDESTAEKQVRLFRELLELKATDNPGILKAREQLIKATEAELIKVTELQRNEEDKRLKLYETTKATRKAQEIEAAKEREKSRQKEIANELLEQRDKNQRLLEQSLSSGGFNKEAELARFERLKQETNKELEILREKKLATEAIEQEFITRKALLEQQSQAKLKAIQDKADADRLTAQEKGVDFSVNLFDRYTQAANESEQKRKTVALTVSKILLSQKKRDGIKQATIAGSVAIQEAWASAAFPYNVAAVAAAVASSAANIATISGVAHGGLTNVPAESTYLLQRNERVLSPNQNKDLTSFMQGGGSAPVINIHNYSGAQVEQRQSGNNIDVFIGRAKEAISDDIRRGVGVSQVMQNAFGLNRAGVV
jgi:Prophage tail length tape measure protein